MTSERTTTFATERSDYEARRRTGETVVLAPALHMPSKVRGVAAAYRALATQANSITVLNPLAAARVLPNLRMRFDAGYAEADELLKECIARMSEPTEGTTASDLAWIQGFTFAAGLSAFTDLQSAVAAASEALDRKAAYSIASFSLYVAIVSLIATVVLGLLSLR